MKIDWFTKAILTLIAAMLLAHLLVDFKPTTAYAAGSVKVVKAEDFYSGAILGFSCVAVGTAAHSTSTCYILTRQ